MLYRGLWDSGNEKNGPAPVRGKVSGRVQTLLLLEGVPEDCMLFYPRPHFTDSALPVSQDWKRHKPFCKADATKSSVPSLNASNDTTENTVQRATPSKDVNSDKSEGRATGHSIDGPARHGGTARANSKTPGTRTMGELRKVAGGDNR